MLLDILYILYIFLDIFYFLKLTWISCKKLKLQSSARNVEKIAQVKKKLSL